MKTISPFLGLSLFFSSSLGQNSGTVQPIFRDQIPAEQPIIMQSQGLALNPMDESNVEMAEFLQHPNMEGFTWQHRGDHKLESRRHHGRCLSMAQEGSFSLRSCDDPGANAWTWHSKGFLYEPKWKKMVGMRNRKLYSQDFNENTAEPSLIWSRWAYSNQPGVGAASQYSPWTKELQEGIPLSFRDSHGMHLIVENNNNNQQYPLSLTSNPNAFQQLNWVLKDGRLRHAIYNQCLNVLQGQNVPGLGPCEGSAASKWQYNHQQKVLYEVNMGKALAFINNAVHLMDYQLNQPNVDERYQCHAYYSTNNQPFAMTASNDMVASSSSLTVAWFTPTFMFFSYLSYSLF